MAKKPKKPQLPKPVSVGGYTQPPFLSYDPSIEAQRQAAFRGLKDTRQDVRIDRRQNRQDFNQALASLRIKKERGTQDFATQLTRGVNKINLQREDVANRQRRGNEDFATRITNLTRQFGQLGTAQNEQAQAAGVAEGGTRQASANARAANFALARAPIDTAAARLNQDTGIAQNRLDAAQGQLQTDVNQGLGRLNQDVARNKFLATRQYARQGLADRLKVSRAAREQGLADLQSIQEEIYNARQNHPGAFAKFGTKKKKGP